MNDPLHPSAALLAKIASLVYHLEEFMDDGHAFDLQAAKALRENEEVEEWFAAMRDLSMLPLKRRASAETPAAQDIDLLGYLKQQMETSAAQGCELHGNKDCTFPVCSGSID